MTTGRAEPARLAVLVSGRGSNLQAILDACARGELAGLARVEAVISDNPRAQALDRARAAGVPMVYLLARSSFRRREEYDRALDELLEHLHPDLVCLAGYMRLVAPATVARWRGRMLNIHPALLPAFPGLHAQRQALEYGVRVSGCTVHLVDEGMDTGPILLQEAVPVYPDDTEDTLAARILQVEHRLYPAAIRLILTRRWRLEGRKVIFEESDEG
ncbi:MAG: phosphoribosylglycinamide formyltransferase [Limnochordales bacterium]|nr:phosphoribosylglycinamide formyltransferase [Limnochordales bacterium]